MKISWTVSPLLGLAMVIAVSAAGANPNEWKHEWPNTDFTKSSIDFGDILSGGPPKDGIPSIDDPQFVAVADREGLADTEPVISVSLNGDSRAYPIQILIWHEIVNDTVGDVPITVTFCPLCNTSLVFDRRVAGRVLDFGTRLANGASTTSRSVPPTFWNSRRRAIRGDGSWGVACVI